MSNREALGWNLGTGIEYAVSPSWTVRAEYQFVCLGVTTQFSIDNIDSMGHFLRVGLNYNFNSIAVRGAEDAARAMPEKAPAAVAVYRWTGLYVGALAGGSAERRHAEYDVGGVPAGSAVDISNGGFLGFGLHGLAGIEAGYNRQFDHIVVGLETDFQITQILGDSINSRFRLTSGGTTGVLTGLTEISKLGTIRDGSALPPIVSSIM